MNLTFKWRTAAAAALAVTLVAGGTLSASAAQDTIKNPQSNGSPGSFFLFDGENGSSANDTTGTRVYDRGEALTIGAVIDDVESELMPADFLPAGVGYSQVFKFVSTADNVNTGTNGWAAWAITEAAGLGGGLYYDSFTLEDRGVGNMEKVWADGGDYYAGLAFTINNGVTVVGKVYRTVHITPGTGKYTIDPVELVGTVPTQPIVEADLTPALKTLTVTAPAAGSTVIGINAGASNANKTLKVGAFSALTDLGQVTLDANGAGTVDVAGKGLSAGTEHKLFLAESDSTVVAWNTFTLLANPNSDDTNLTVGVTGGSNRFELIAPAATTVDLGDVKRNQTTAAVSLGQFSVIDDRDQMLGWNLAVNATAFAGANNATIANTALGYKAVAAGGNQTGVSLGAVKVAGAGSFGLLAEGAPNSTTTEAGAQFNADLTFKAPVDAAKGAYNSTLTLDLVSK